MKSDVTTKTNAGSFRSCLLILGFLFCCSGCSQPLRTLMAVNAEQKAQQDSVHKENQQFERLLKDIKACKIKQGMARSLAIKRYGSPVLEAHSEVGKTLLYRNPVVFLHATKVYLNFDEHDILVSAKIDEKNAQESQ